MARQDPGRLQSREPVEGGERLVRVVGERRGLRAGAAGEDVPGGQGVPDEDGVGGRDVDAHAAGGVPGHPDDHRGAGQVQDVAVADLGHLGDVAGAQAVLADRVSEEAEGRADAHRAERGLGLLAGPGAGGEIQLTDALQMQAVDGRCYGLRFNGVRYDTGTPLGFLTTSIAYALKRPDIAPGLRDYMRQLVEEDMNHS